MPQDCDSAHVALKISQLECLKASNFVALPSMLRSCEDLKCELAIYLTYEYDSDPTLLHPGNSHAWTRLPFFALLIRWVVGVYVIGSTTDGGPLMCRILEPSWGPTLSDAALDGSFNVEDCARVGFAPRVGCRRRALDDD